MAFPSQQSEFAVAQAAISAIGASLSGLLGGAAADWVVSQAGEDSPDPIGRRLWIPVIGSVLAAPTWYFAVNSGGSFETAMLWLAAEYFVAGRRLVHCNPPWRPKWEEQLRVPSP